jgi:hypothetical protein
MGRLRDGAKARQPAFGRVMIESAACAEVRELAAGHLADIRAKTADLRAMARVLSDAARRCDAGEDLDAR